MTSPSRPLFSICIPAYNRARHLRELLDSIFAEEFSDYEVVICEDGSPERAEIARIAREYEARYPGRIRYFENEENLGYDGNIRRLVERAGGRFCFFMGNDDLLNPGALRTVAGAIERHPQAGLIVKAYMCFDDATKRTLHEIRYVKEETELPAGVEAIRFAFRRSGVISGYIVDRDAAHAVATSKLDGTLYYQMHLTARVLTKRSAVCLPEILVRCRAGEPPDFGASVKEKGKYVPGRYVPEARVNMVSGALSIIEDLRESEGVDVVDAVVRDYANYFYPYIKDQLTLPPRRFYKLYRDYGRLGFARYPLFHAYFALGYLLGEKRFDAMAEVVRRRLGRSPRL